jgi:ribonuclease R
MSKKPKIKKSIKIDEVVYQIFKKNSSKLFDYKQIKEKIHAKFTTEEVLKSLYKLLLRKKVAEIEKGQFQLKYKEQKVVEGKIQITQQKSGYVIVDGLENDIYVPKGATKNALNGDFVSVAFEEKEDKKSRGSVVEIKSRKKTQFVGVLQLRNPKYGFVVVDDSAVHVDFYVSQNLLNGAIDGQKVVVELVRWEENRDSPDGKIIEVLGNPGEHEVEIHSILLEYNLPYTFTEEIENEANKINTEITKEEIKKRKDIRNVFTLTIDPKDAKDFDDAISIQTLENGNTEIGIHIADVSHYLEPNSILDNEAYARATSVYLVDRVVPMLPEILSNQVCSLRPNEEKLTFSIFFEFNLQYKIVNQWIGRTVIKSNHRFTYEEAQHIIETEQGLYANEVMELHKIATKLRKNRIKDGAISFDKLEVKFKLNEENKPEEIYFKMGKEANHLVEEFMLLANKKVAEFIGLKNGKESNDTFIYRIHDEPNYDKINDLKLFVKKFGYTIETKNKDEIRQSLNLLLKEIKGSDEENMIETLAMRCMSKAIYSTKNIGHYGLAFDYYSHFTSPIRRYPDVMTHRLLQHYLNKGISVASDEYEQKCRHSSEREKLASQAERDSIKYMQSLYMQRYLGKELDGIISGVTEWGMYIEIPESLAEGLIRVKNMQGDYYKFDPKNHCMVGERTGKKYQLGSKIKVFVANIDTEKKQIDFELI